MRRFIFPVDHSKEMALLTLESMRQYKELGVFVESGGIEVARGGERMQELSRRVGSAISWGIEPVSMLTPDEVKELVPFINEQLIVGGFYTPGAGVVDSLRAATLMRERAQEKGLTVAANTEVLGIDVEGGRVTGSARPGATSRPSAWSSRPARGVRGWRTWPAPRSP